MDKAIEEVFKTFNHLAREVLIYFLSGAVVLLNALYLDQAHHAGVFWNAIRGHSFLIPGMLVASYVLGQFCFAFYYTVLEHTGLEDFLERILKIDLTEQRHPKTHQPFVDPEREKNFEHDKAALFAKSETIYRHFVERLVLMEYVRWNLSAAFVVVGISDGLVWWLCRCRCRCEPDYELTGWMTLVAFFVALCFYLLGVFTHYDNVNALAQYSGAAGSGVSAAPPVAPAPPISDQKGGDSSGG